MCCCYCRRRRHCCCLYASWNLQYQEFNKFLSKQRHVQLTILRHFCNWWLWNFTVQRKKREEWMGCSMYSHHDAHIYVDTMDWSKDLIHFLLIHIKKSDRKCFLFERWYHQLLHKQISTCSQWNSQKLILSIERE